jgi:hypothetical protein
LRFAPRGAAESHETQFKSTVALPIVPDYECANDPLCPNRQRGRLDLCLIRCETRKRHIVLNYECEGKDFQSWNMSLGGGPDGTPMFGEPTPEGQWTYTRGPCRNPQRGAPNFCNKACPTRQAVIRSIGGYVCERHQTVGWIGLGVTLRFEYNGQDQLYNPAVGNHCRTRNCDVYRRWLITLAKQHNSAALGIELHTPRITSMRYRIVLNSTFGDIFPVGGGSQKTWEVNGFTAVYGEGGMISANHLLANCNIGGASVSLQNHSRVAWSRHNFDSPISQLSNAPSTADRMMTGDPLSKFLYSRAWERNITTSGNLTTITVYAVWWCAKSCLRCPFR